MTKQPEHMTFEWPPLDDDQLTQIANKKIQTVLKVGEQHAHTLETHLQAFIKPRPEWMPEHVWRWMIKELIEVRMDEKHHDR